MDYFKKVTASNHKEKGLQDYFIGGRVNIRKDAFLKMKLHHFKTEYSYISAINGKAVRNLGEEIDILFEYYLHKGLSTKTALDIFLPTEEWMGKDNDPSVFIYTILTYRI